MAYVPAATPSSMMRRGSGAISSNGIGSILGMCKTPHPSPESAPESSLVLVTCLL